jgi:hypothetical protein
MVPANASPTAAKPFGLIVTAREDSRMTWTGGQTR